MKKILMVFIALLFTTTVCASQLTQNSSSSNLTNVAGSQQVKDDGCDEPECGGNQDPWH